jgi:hypothetical protein
LSTGRQQIYSTNGAEMVNQPTGILYGYTMPLRTERCKTCGYIAPDRKLQLHFALQTY